MGFDWIKAMGFDKLGLYYNIRMDGLDGECFEYSVYFENGLTDEKFGEADKAIDEFLKPYNEKEIYMGYIAVSRKDDKINIYLDLGNVKPQYENVSIKGILQALNNVSGIKSVVVNEGCDYDFPDDFEDDF